MNKEFIPYEEALALKELGFNTPCLARYIVPDFREGNTPILEIWNDEDTEYKPKYTFLAPLYQQAFRWFREKHKLVSEIQAPDGKNGKWNPTIHKVYGFGNYYDNDGFDTYEEAELACLRKLIEIVNQNKDGKRKL